jgi:hypothetical protein
MTDAVQVYDDILHSRRIIRTFPNLNPVQWLNYILFRQSTISKNGCAYQVICGGERKQ